MDNQNEITAGSAATPAPAPQPAPNILSRFKITPGVIKKGLTILAGLVLLFGGYYWYAVSQRVYSDKAEIYAPLISLSPAQSGILDKVLVADGDQVNANQAIARLDNGDFVRAKTDGMIVSINNQVGKSFSPSLPVVTMINPEDLRLIVHVAENKGLSSIKVGQKVIFTVDAFGSRKFYGQVEEILQTSDQSSVVFSISDKRDEKYFSIKVKFSGYPELLNGMSAKAWIYR